MFGERLKQRRAELGYTQQEAADKIGISREHYAKLEQDRHALSVSCLQQISTAFEVSYDWLLGTSEPGVKSLEDASSHSMGKYLVLTPDGRYICRAKHCPWRDETGFCNSGAGCMKEWEEQHGR